MKPLAITGMGIYTSLGEGLATNWQQLSNGQSGVKEISRFPTNDLPVTIAATIDKPHNALDGAEYLIQQVLSQAIAHSALSTKELMRAQLVVALGPRELEFPLRASAWQSYYDVTQKAYDWQKIAAEKKLKHLHAYATYMYFVQQLQQQYAFTKIPVHLNTACASGASAIQLAATHIQSGQTPISIAIGAEYSVVPETIVRFALLTALSTDNAHPAGASKPFSLNRDGFVLGEGAGALVLEDVEHAKARGAPILAYLIGCGDSTDNFHRTRSHPSGERVALCMQKALNDAHILPSQVDYINAHGTSTPENDKMECKGIQLLFGDHCQQLFVSSNKSMIGHTLSAAGAIEAVFSVLTLQQQVIPPTINYHVPDPDISLNVVPNQAIAAKINIALSNSFGFGGQNVSLVFANTL